MNVIDNRYQGFGLDELREWLVKRADSRGYVDLVDTGLPDAFRDAWHPDAQAASTKLDVYPRGSCPAQIDDAGEIRIDYAAQVYSDKGGIGGFRRRLELASGRAVHSLYELPDEEWGRGHGKRLMRRSVELYLRLGLTRIGVTAIGIGKYLWPMCGFTSESRDEHERTVQSMADFFADLGYNEELPRYQHLWEYPAALDLDDQGNDVLVSAGAIRDAFERAGRSFDVTGLPDPINPQIALTKALLIYNRTAAWPGVFRLDGWHDDPCENPQIAQLCAYTQHV